LNGKDKSNNKQESDRNLFDFVKDKTDEYKQNTIKQRMVMDYIAGQTDKFFLKECETYLSGFKVE